MFIIYYTVRERERERGTSSSCTPPSCMHRHAATRLVRCVFRCAHERIGKGGRSLLSSSSARKNNNKGKAEREGVKGKGINYCRVPGEICKLNSAREKERYFYFFFSPSSPLLSLVAFRDKRRLCFDYD